MSAPRSPSGEAPRGPPDGLLILVVAGVLAVHLVAAALVHLTEDEAYYRLWSFRPAFGYFDHPPMIAWWVWAGRALAGDNALGVRLLPTLGSCLTTLIVYDLARLAGGDRPSARLSAIFYSATFLVGAGGFLAVPDAPTSLFWAASLWCALKARREGRRAWWLCAGAAAALAVLSKYSALFLPPGLALWLLATEEGRLELRRPAPWLGAALAVVIFSVNIAWNAEHHWLTFAKQFGRVGAGHLAPIHLPEFLIGQALLLNPLIAALAVRGLAQRRARLAGTPELAPFLLTIAPFMVYLLIHSLHDRVQAHWPAPLYAAAAICAAAGAREARGGWKAIGAAAPVLGFFLCAVAFLWLLAPGAAAQLRFDPALPIRGWPTFAAKVENVRVRSEAAWVGAASYGLAAELADEPGVRAPVVELFERARWNTLARGEQPDFSRPGLVVDLPRRIDMALFQRCFVEADRLGSLGRGDPGGPSITYAVVRVALPRRAILAQGCG